MTMTSNQAQLCRLSLRPSGGNEDPEADLLCRLSYPLPVFLHLSSASIEGDAIPVLRQGNVEEDALEVVMLPSGSHTSFALQQSASSWLGTAENGGRFERLAIDIKLRHGQIAIRGRRVILQSAPDVFMDMLAGIGAFIWLWLSIDDTESKLESGWDDQHVDAGALERLHYSGRLSRSMAAKAAATARLRQWFLKATLMLERGDRGLSAAARRGFAELCQQMDLGRRVQLLGEVIEAREVLYGAIAERSFEYRLFLFSIVIEVAILAGILVEVAIMFYDL